MSNRGRGHIERRKQRDKTKYIELKVIEIDVRRERAATEAHMEGKCRLSERVCMSVCVCMRGDSSKSIDLSKCLLQQNNSNMILLK